jgi:hypothetical protein
VRELRSLHCTAPAKIVEGHDNQILPLTAMLANAVTHHDDTRRGIVFPFESAGETHDDYPRTGNRVRSQFLESGSFCRPMKPRRIPRDSDEFFVSFLPNRLYFLVTSPDQRLRRQRNEQKNCFP